MDKGTAQGRKVASNYPHDGFRSKGSILEVGSACLSKKFRGQSCAFADDDNGKRRLQCATSDNKPKLHPTGSYTPNSSRKRKALRTDNVRASEDHLDIRLVRNSKHNWREIWDLGHTLAFETLRTTLLILLVVVRLGAAWAEHVEDWLGTEGLQKDSAAGQQLNPEEQDISDISDISDSLDSTVCADSTDSTGSTDGSTDFTDAITGCAKLTDVRKCPMSDHGDQYTTFPQIGLSASTSERQETPQTTPPLQTAMATMLCVPMPLPGTLGSPMFEGANVTEFLERYEDLCSDYRVSDEDRLARLPRYCIQPVAETIRSLKEWKTKDYAALKKALLSEYRDDDTRQLLYSVPFLESYKNILRTEDDDILDYCRQFDRIAQHCIGKGVLAEYTARVWFIHGLPLPTASRLIRKFAIDTEDPTTVDYQQQLEHVKKQAMSDKAVQRVNATRNPSQKQTEAVSQVTMQLRPVVLVTEEQRLREPVVKPMTTTTTTSETAVDQLTKAITTFSVNLLQQAQSQQSF
jgi:hypothetical protein